MASSKVRPSIVDQVDLVGGMAGGIASLYKVFDAEVVGGVVDVESIGPGRADASLAPFGFQVTDYRNYGVWVKAASAGVPELKLYVMMSWDDVVADYAIVEPGVQALSIGDTNPHCLTLPVVSAMRFMRLRVSGTGANPADTTVSLYLHMKS